MVPKNKIKYDCKIKEKLLVIDNIKMVENGTTTLKTLKKLPPNSPTAWLGSKLAFLPPHEQEAIKITDLIKTSASYCSRSYKQHGVSLLGGSFLVPIEDFT